MQEELCSPGKVHCFIGNVNCIILNKRELNSVNIHRSMCLIIFSWDFKKREYHNPLTKFLCLWYQCAYRCDANFVISGEKSLNRNLFTFK